MTVTLLDFIPRAQGGMDKTAQERRDNLEKRGKGVYKVGSNLALSHVKQGAEKAMEGEGGGEGGEKKEKEESSEERVAKRTQEIYENLKKGEGNGSSSGGENNDKKE